SDAYLQLRVQPDGIALRWDIALRDLDTVLAIDADNDRRLTWREVGAAEAAIADHALAHLSIEGCTLQVTGRALERRSDGAYAALSLRGPGCRFGRDSVLHYTLFADSDPTHRRIA